MRDIKFKDDWDWWKHFECGEWCDSSKKISIKNLAKHVECQLSNDGSKRLDGKMVIRVFLQTLKVCAKDVSKSHDVGNHEVLTSSLGRG